jgi:hypothetical protein
VPHFQNICYLSLRHDFTLQSGDKTATYTTYLFINSFLCIYSYTNLLYKDDGVERSDMTGFWTLCSLVFFRITGDGQSPSQGSTLYGAPRRLTYHFIALHSYVICTISIKFNTSYIGSVMLLYYMDTHSKVNS